MYASNKPQKQSEKPAVIALLTHRHYVFIKIRRLLARHEIRTIYMLGKKTFHMVRLVKDALGAKIPRVYCIPFKYSKVYVGHTGRTLQARHKRNKALTSWPTRYFCHETNHIASGHEINFDSIYRLSNATSYMDCFLVKETIEICLHSNSFSWKDGFMLEGGTP